MSFQPDFVPELPRSQIRRSIFDTLCSINTANTAPGNTLPFGTDVRQVLDAWTTEDEITDLPAIQFRFDTAVNEAQQSQELRIIQTFETRLVVGGRKETLGAQIDRLRDDVIAALYANSRFGGYGYGLQLLSEQEIPQADQTRRTLIARWEMRYTRVETIEANRITPVP